MRMTKGRMVLTVVMAFSLLLVGAANHASVPAVQAAKFNANPAPYGQYKVQITPPALIALARQAGNAPTNQGGDNGNPLVALFPPHKPVGSGGSGEGTGNSSGPPGPQGGINSAPSGSIAFNNDPSALEQNETSVTVKQTSGVPTNSAGADQVVGGANDFRGFYFAPFCSPNPGSYCYPARNCVSLSGFSVSLSGGSSVDKSSCLPWVNGSFQPFGDPALDRDTSGNVYYGSLGFDQSAGSGKNGIIIHRSTPELFNPANKCQNTSATSNPCWKGQVVSVGDQGTNPSSGACDPTFCSFADKDWIAVDRYSSTPYKGDVYVDWNSFTTAGPKAGDAQILLSRCHPDAASPTGFAYCTAPVSISNPADQFTGGGSYLTTTRSGYVLAVYANFGTPTTLYPIDYRIAVIAPGGQTVLGYINIAHLTQNGDSTTTPCLPNTDPANSFEFGAPCKDNTGIGGLAGVTMRSPQFVKIDVNRATGDPQNNDSGANGGSQGASKATNDVYTTFELCTLPQYYPITDPSGNIFYAGNCPKTDVLVARTQVSISGSTFTNTPVRYTDITRSAPGQQFFPTVSVDERSGEALVTYNSTQDDPFQNMDSVYSQLVSTADGSAAAVRAGEARRITSTPYQITKDPAGYFGQGAPPCGAPGSLPNAAGCPGYAPENGDYLQGLAFFGHLYVHYTGTYLQKALSPQPGTDALTFFDATLPMNQDDNFLSRTGYGQNQ